MDVSAQTLREVEFREKLRGYHPDDVDEFLERVAAGIEFLQERLREATERAVRAEQRVAEGGDDDALKRTLVLAQRTAELAVQEAREEADRIQSGARAEALTIVARAEELARRTIEEAQGPLRSELTQLESARDELRSDITTLERHLDQERTSLRAKLSEALNLVEAAMPAPTPLPPLHEIEVPPLRVPQAVDIDIPLDDEEPEPEPMADEPEAMTDEEAPAGLGVPAGTAMSDERRAISTEPEHERNGAAAFAEFMASPPAPPPPPSAYEEHDSPFAAAGEDEPEREPEHEPEPVAVAAAHAPEAALSTEFGDEDDPFIAELRRAITDPEPLGPREEEGPTAESEDPSLEHDELLEGGRLGSLLRRKR